MDVGIPKGEMGNLQPASHVSIDWVQMQAIWNLGLSVHVVQGMKSKQYHAECSRTMEPVSHRH